MNKERKNNTEFEIPPVPVLKEDTHNRTASENGAGSKKTPDKVKDLKGKQLLQFVFLLLFLFCIVFILDYRCPFRLITGIYCPGCGMSRALISLFQRDFQNSWSYHPFLIPTLVLAVLAAVLYFRGYRKQSQQVIWVWAAGMMVCWVFRILIPLFI